MERLVTLQGFAERRGVDFDPTDLKARRALDDASAFIRSYTGQTLSLVQDDEVELRGTWRSVLFLPERPVIDVTEVSVRYHGSTAFALVTGYVQRGAMLHMSGGYWGGDTGAVVVTYSHGNETIPADLAAVCASIAARGMADLGGALVSETMGPYSYTLGTNASGGPLGLTDNEARVLRRYTPAEEVPVP